MFGKKNKPKIALYSSNWLSLLKANFKNILLDTITYERFNNVKISLSYPKFGVSSIMEYAQSLIKYFPCTNIQPLHFKIRLRQEKQRENTFKKNNY